MQAKERAYRNLASAIILKAVEDYRNALNDIGYDNESPEEVIKEVEKFFRSERFMSLTRVRGEFLIKHLKEEHLENERSKNESNVNTSNTKSDKHYRKNSIYLL